MAVAPYQYLVQEIFGEIVVNWALFKESLKVGPHKVRNNVSVNVSNGTLVVGSVSAYRSSFGDMNTSIRPITWYHVSDVHSFESAVIKGKNQHFHVVNVLTV